MSSDSSITSPLSSATGCRHCGSVTDQVKNGHDSSGSVRLKCQSCGRTYAAMPRERGRGQAVRLQAVRCYLEGMSFRRISRLLDVNHQSVINWVNAYHTQAKEQVSGFPHQNASPSAHQTQPHDDRTGERSLQTLEGDELFTFIGSKKTPLTS